MGTTDPFTTAPTSGLRAATRERADPFTTSSDALAAMDERHSLDVADTGELRVVTGTCEFIVVCNRLPVEMHVSGDGVVTWTRSPGGLVSALESVLGGRDAAWIGWSGHAIDDTLPVADLPDGLMPWSLYEVALTRDEVEGHYEGFCNQTLWPLYHDAVVTPTYHRRMWDVHVAVNQRFAQVVASHAAYRATVWVHDYQLQLVPAMLREMRPDLTIGFFLHIPFPPSELFVQMPWRTQVMQGLLGADLIGFQTRGAVENFLAITRRRLGLTCEGDVISVEGPRGPREVSVGAFPIAVDSRGFDEIARRPDVQARAREIRNSVGNPENLLLGVDRLDYTKGIDVRLKAITELLEDGLVNDSVFVQIATPSRENVEEYQRMRDEIDLMVGRAIGDHGLIGAPPIQYQHAALQRDELIAYYVAADVMLVTPYRDGMNLIAKEYVASRINGDGALVLSEFTGSAIDLPQAYLVNPHDADGVKRAILDALHSSHHERLDRMSAMRAQVFTHDVEAWASGYLGALSRAAPAL